MTIEDNTFFCSGHDLSVANDVSLSGTLDAHTGGDPNVELGDLHVLSGGMYKATAGTTVIVRDFKNEGRFRHNNGTVAFKDTDHSYVNRYGLSATGENAFYDLTGTGTGLSGITLYGSIDIQHDLFESGNAVQLRLRWNGTVVTFGTDDYASQVGISYFDSSGGYAPITVQSVNSAYPAVFKPTISRLRFFGHPDEGGYMSHSAHAKWVDVQKAVTMPTNAGPKTLTLDGDCRFAGFSITSSNTFITGSHNVIFDGNLNIATGGTYNAGAGTTIVAGDYTNRGTFVCGTSTMVLTNGSTSVDNSNQAFHNLTSAPGGGNTVTLAAGTIPAISNLLHVVSGTCRTRDEIDKVPTGPGTYISHGHSSNTIACGVSPHIEAGATLEMGYEDADLRVTKAVTGGSEAAGEDLIYTITVTNVGPLTASNVWVVDTLPAGVTTTDDLTNNVGDLAAGAVTAREFTVSIGESTVGLITNTATVGSDTVDPASGNNTDTAVSFVRKNEYIWTGDSDESTWTDSGNWDPPSGYPDDSEDKATIPVGPAHAIHTDLALTIGELEMQSGCTATLTLGGAFSLSTNGSRNGNLTVSGGTFYCSGNDLDVYGTMELHGTLDGHTGGEADIHIRSFYIRGSGAVFSAPGGSGSLHVKGSMYSNGTFTHNSGTVTFDGVAAQSLNYHSYAYRPIVFYNVTVDKPTAGNDGELRVYGYRPTGSTTIVENVLTIMDGEWEMTPVNQPSTCCWARLQTRAE